MTSTTSSSKGARGPKISRTPGISPRMRTRAAARKSRTPKVPYSSCQQTDALLDDTPSQNKPRHTFSTHDQNAGSYQSPSSATISMHSEPSTIDPALGHAGFSNYSPETWQQYPVGTFAIGAHLDSTIPRSCPIDEGSSLSINATFFSHAPYHEPYHVNNMANHMASLPNIDTSVLDIFLNQPYPSVISDAYAETSTVYDHYEVPSNQTLHQQTASLQEQHIEFDFNQMDPPKQYEETVRGIDIKYALNESSLEGDEQIYDDDQIQTYEGQCEPGLDEEKISKVSEEGTNSKGKAEAVVFACPFFRLDHIRYMSCLNLKMTRIRDVKQHLQRRHYHVPIYCKRCHVEFCSSAMLCEHVDRKGCRPRAQPVALHLQGVSRAAQQQLKYPMHRTMALNDQWYKIWDILFPREPRPNNPYLGTFLKETMDMIEKFWRLEGAAVTKKVIKENPSAGKVGNDVNLIMAALLKEVRLQQEQPTQNISPSGSVDSASNSG